MSGGDPWELLKQYIQETENPVDVAPELQPIHRPIPLRPGGNTTNISGRVRFQVAQSDIKELIPHRIRRRGVVNIDEAPRDPYIRGNYSFVGYGRSGSDRQQPIFLTHMGLYRSPQSARNNAVHHMQRYSPRTKTWVIEIPVVVVVAMSSSTSTLIVRVSHPKIKSFLVTGGIFLRD